MRIADLRREYKLGGIRRSDLAADPLAQFQLWFNQVAEVRRSSRLRALLIQLYKVCFSTNAGPVIEVNAATLATADKQGRPSARIVLLKGVDERGFIFFTNYESRKGCELAENPHAALVFYWSNQERQVCIAGDVMKISSEESTVYFQSRPRRSRLAAWASKQSRSADGRFELERKMHEVEVKFSNCDVPLPPNWGGYVLSPSRIEFWQGRPNRLHDRFCYQKQSDKTWQLERLFP